ncbi:hypothetical protein C1645_874602 [Glomus cerebriforme]|uniref:F-box domain-containing protein n=1 Tax=Glomus cerebriforme TaxID=658196 RepID=A0A397T8K4_9GLOM|nr:hypothetical protein C1645_874602 [Glomus cerebriforme]
MQYVDDKIKTTIFKYTDFPLNLALTCRNWSLIVKDPNAKFEWLVVHYGKEHVLFYAVALGPTFIDAALCQTLIARNIMIPRYFIQRLLMHFGNYDQKLFQLNIEYNVGTNNKGNDMELLFHAAGPHVINYEYRMLKKILKVIKDLFLNNRFVPFLPRSKAFQLDSNTVSHINQSSIPKAYPSKDGYLGNDKFNSIKQIKSFDFLGQGNFLRQYQTRPLTVLMLRMRPLRRINQRRRHYQLRRRQIMNNIYQRHNLNVPIDNEDTLNRIANLPRQQITNDPLIDQFFNGYVSIDNEDTLNRIANLPRQQITNDPLIDQFFHGSLFI